ncbi:hypothetical protein ACU686_45285 [Yinghuangia aomiensis]
MADGAVLMRHRRPGPVRVGGRQPVRGGVRRLRGRLRRRVRGGALAPPRRCGAGGRPTWFDRGRTVAAAVGGDVYAYSARGRVAAWSYPAPVRVLAGGTDGAWLCAAGDGPGVFIRGVGGTSEDLPTPGPALIDGLALDASGLVAGRAERRRAHRVGLGGPRWADAPETAPPGRVDRPGRRRVAARRSGAR